MRRAAVGVEVRRPSANEAGHIPCWHGSSEGNALSPVAAARRWLLLLLSSLLSAAIRPAGGLAQAGLCAWCAHPIQAKARRDAVCCSVRCRQARHRFLRAIGHAESVAPTVRSRLSYADPPSLAERQQDQLCEKPAWRQQLDNSTVQICERPALADLLVHVWFASFTSLFVLNNRRYAPRHEVYGDRNPDDWVQLPYLRCVLAIPTPDVTIARRVLTFLEDRQVLYAAYEVEVPERSIASVMRVRDFLTGLLGDHAMGHDLTDSLRAMRAACRKFMNEVDNRSGGPIGRPLGIYDTRQENGRP